MASRVFPLKLVPYGGLVQQILAANVLHFVASFGVWASEARGSLISSLDIGLLGTTVFLMNFACWQS